MSRIISEEKLTELLESHHTMLALEGGGVDNWQWYEDSLDNYLSDNAVGDFDTLVALKIQDYPASRQTYRASAKKQTQFEQGGLVYYNNNPAIMVADYGNTVLLRVSNVVDFSCLEGKQFCTVCQAAGNDGSHPTHACHEYDDVISALQDEAQANQKWYYVTAPKEHIAPKPLVITKYEKDMERLQAATSDVIVMKEERAKEEAALVAKLIHLRAEISGLEEHRDLLSLDPLSEKAKEKQMPAP